MEDNKISSNSIKNNQSVIDTIETFEIEAAIGYPQDKISKFFISS